jgi:hypothetical protein
MNKSFDIFNWQRFVRVFLNDLMLLQARRMAFASLGLAGMGILVYLAAAGEAAEGDVEVALTLFSVLLIGGGQIFTSMIYNDMHHPLERFQYLMLPCANLERFISRYLITAPLYLVYAVVLYKVFEVVANFALAVLFEAPPIPALDIGSEEARRIMLGYFASHVFVYCAAIWFRSYALIKLMAASFLFWMACAALMFLTIRILYWDSFISLFELNPDGPFPNIEFGPESFVDREGNFLVWAKVTVLAFLGWILFLAYLGLKEHEVQDGL